MFLSRKRKSHRIFIVRRLKALFQAFLFFCHRSFYISWHSRVYIDPSIHVKQSPSLLPSLLPLCELCNHDMKELSWCFPDKDPQCACSVLFFFLIHLIHPASNPSIYLSINTIMNFQQIRHPLSLSFLAQRSQKDSAKNKNIGCCCCNKKQVYS